MRIFVDDYLQVRYVNLYNEKVHNDLKLLVIGDIHISDLVSLKKIDLLKKQILKEKADYVIFTGDLIDSVEEINNRESIFKLKTLLESASEISKTIVILGNHDYIHRKKYNSYIKEISNLIKSINRVILLDNDIYSDNKIWIMGYTETVGYYGKEKYNYNNFYEDFIKYDLLYKNINKNVPTVAVTHSPEFSNSSKCLNLFKDYDLILCGHTHDGCIPFGLGNFNRGIISSKKNLFPKNTRGIRKLGNNYILITGGVVKISKCALKLLQPLNHLCPMQMDVVTLSNQYKFNLTKKWY